MKKATYAKLSVGISLALAMAFISPAVAQRTPAETDKPIFYPAPPAGFNAEAASEAELAQYGLPPRPNPSEPVLYARWKRMVTAPQTRLTNPTVETTNVINGAAIGRVDRLSIGNPTATTTENWSGYAVTAANGTFQVSGSYVYAAWVVPAVGVDNCTYSPYGASQWVGFDGAFVSNDVLQAGTAVTACGTSYVAWYEWFTDGCSGGSSSYPCYQTNVNLPISPGDVVETEVWYSTSAPRGHASIWNFTTEHSVSVGFNQPSGYGSSAYLGNSVEWVVERPTQNGSLVNLANYVETAMTSAGAFDGSSSFFPGSSPAGTSIYDIAMTCPPWNPSSACTSTTNLSVPYLYGTYTLWFDAAGPAYQ